MKEGWKTNFLLKVCKVYQPHTIATSKLKPGAPYDVFGANGCIGKYDQYNHEEDEILLTCRGATCGNINRSTPKSWINGNAMVVHPISDNITKDFLMYALKSIDFSKVITGAAQPQITRISLSSVIIPIPPLPEQERIVSLLDAEFAKIDAIKANAEKQLQDAKALFQSALKDYLTPKEGWKICKIGEIAHIRRGLTYSKSDEVDNSNNIVLRSNNIDLSTNKLVYDELKFIHQSINIPEDKYLKKGELLMCMSNGSKVHLGKVALNETDSIYVFGGFMAAISHDNSLIDKFFFYSLITPRFKEYIKSLSDGANINNLKARDIENYTIPIPPLLEQERIVSLLDGFSAKIQSLQSNFDTTVTLCNDLKQSILKDIFG